MTNLPPIATPGPLLPYLLAALAPMSRTRVKELLHTQCVRVNDTPTTRHDHPLAVGDRVTVGERPPPDRLSSKRIHIVHDDDALIVLDKPVGLLSVSTEGEKRDTAFARLNSHLELRRGGRPFVVHRLDRDTSGLLLFARSADVRDKLQAAWDTVEKTYLAVVCGVPKPAEGTINNYLAEGRGMKIQVVAKGEGGKRAISRYRTVKAGKYSLVQVVIETGRKHQIRVHLAGIGCQMIGDSVYGTPPDPAGRLGLHAWKLAFAHPVTGDRLELESPLPAALRRVVG